MRVGGHPTVVVQWQRTSGSSRGVMGSTPGDCQPFQHPIIYNCNLTPNQKHKLGSSLPPNHSYSHVSSRILQSAVASLYTCMHIVVTIV